MFHMCVIFWKENTLAIFPNIIWKWITIFTIWYLTSVLSLWLGLDIKSLKPIIKREKYLITSLCRFKFQTNENNGNVAWQSLDKKKLSRPHIFLLVCLWKFLSTLSKSGSQSKMYFMSLNLYYSPWWLCCTYIIIKIQYMYL